MPVVTGAEEYPCDIEERIRKAAPEAVFIDALTLARQAGSEKAVNTVLIGAFAKNSDIDKQLFIDAIKETIPQKLIDVNLRAFEKGYEF